MSTRNTRESTKRQSNTSATRSKSGVQKRVKQPASKPSKDNIRNSNKDTAGPSNTNHRIDSADVDDHPEPKKALQIEESTGDIFAAPPNTLIIHACNCQGSWNAGIAKAFKDRYPEAYENHVQHCEQSEDNLVGTAQLIPPTGFEGDTESKVKHFVGCLFTSQHYGRIKDSPSKILAATRPAMEDLLKQVGEWNAQAEDCAKVDEVRICKINSGLFAVPWVKTKAVLEGLDVAGSEVKVVKVIERPG